MAANAVRKGSLVRQARGGPVMTVDAVAGVQASCTWFEEDVQHQGIFELRALTVVDDGRRTWAPAAGPHGGEGGH